MYRNNYDGGDGWTYYPMRIEISDNCPICGCKRGEPKWHNQCEDGEWFQVQTWNNPCGHTDYYGDVYRESKELKEKLIEQ